MMGDYTAKEQQEIAQLFMQIDGVKDAMASAWWKDTMKALEDEISTSLDDLKTVPWSYENLVKICGKIYGIRVFMKSHEDLLAIEGSIDKAKEEIE